MSVESREIDLMSDPDKLDLSRIPEKDNLRFAFREFLVQLQACIGTYRSIPDDKFDQGIGGGDSPRKELIHEVGYVRLRTEAISTGRMDTYSYKTAHPEEYEVLTGRTREQLIEDLISATRGLYEAYTQPGAGDMTVIYPWRTLTGSQMLLKTYGHEAHHTGELVKHGDNLGVPRTEEMKKAWG